MTNQEPNYEKAFDEFYGAHNGCISEQDKDCESNDSEPDYLARADESAAYDENKERYMSVMRRDFPRDFADDDPFTEALLDSCENRGEDDE